MTKKFLADNALRCRECGNPLVLSRYGEWVCPNCGLVHDKVYIQPLFEIEPLSDFSASSKVYVSPDGKPLRKDILGSVMIKSKGHFRDIRGEELNYSRFQRLHLLNSVYSKSSNVRSYLGALQALRRSSSLLNIPKNIYERACYIYYKAINIEKKVGTSYQIAASALLIAAREFKYPITLEEIASVFAELGHRIIPRSVAKVASKLFNALSLKRVIRRPEDYFIRIIDVLKKNERLLHRVKYFLGDEERYFNSLLKYSFEISRMLDNNSRAGKNPYLLSVSVVYAADKLACKKLNCMPILSQKFLAEYLDSTEYTIRQHYKFLKRILTNFLQP